MYFISKTKAIFNKHNKQNEKLLLYFLQPTQSNNEVNNVQQEQSHPRIGQFYVTIKMHKDQLKAQSTYLRNTNNLIIDIETNQIFNALNELNTVYTADIKDM